MPERAKLSIYQGDGDALMQREHRELQDRILLVPDAPPSRTPDAAARIRIMWGQHLLEDLIAGRYRSLVCAVNARDNSHGIIAQLAALLPTSQWDEPSITQHARQFSADDQRQHPKVVKFDMDSVEVLAILRPPRAEHLGLDHLASAFRIVAEMIRGRADRLPSASVSFLGARANQLMGRESTEPSFEEVLRIMHESGYGGDVYPAPSMWSAKTGVFARYPFPPALDHMREGGF